MAKLVNGAELAKILGVSRKTVHVAFRKGWLTAAGTNKRGGPLFDPETAPDEYAHRADRNKAQSHHGAGKSQGGRPRKQEGEPTIDPGEMPDLSGFDGENLPGFLKNMKPGEQIHHVELIRKLNDAKMASLKVSEKEKTLIAAEAVKRDAADLAGVVLSILTALPERLSHVVAAMTDPHLVHMELEKEINLAVVAIRQRCGLAEAGDDDTQPDEQQEQTEK